MLHKVLRDKIIEYNEDVSYNGVYLIYHMVNPDIYYVGSTERVYSKKKCKNGCYGRWIEHYHRLNNNTHHSRYLQNIVNKYGIDGLRFKVIERTDENIRLREKYFIDKYDSYNNGYNSSNETDYITMTDEMKLKASIRMKNNNPMKNKDVVKKRLKSKKELSPPLRVLQYTTDGVFVKDWESTDKICEELGVDSSNINRNINGNSKSSIGYLWFYKLNFTKELLKDKVNYFKEEYVMTEETKNNIGIAQYQKVGKYNLNGELIKEYNSLKEASEELKVHPSNISKACKGVNKTCKGFIWKKV